MDTRAIDVLDFWFGPPDDPGHAQPRAAWFKKDEAFDAGIRERFGTLIEQALDGQLDGWLTRPVQPLPALAAVVVLDQFTRNAFRGTARAFAGDARALQFARALVASGADRMLTGVQRQFCYLPFEHAEDLSHQRTSVQLFQQLERDEPALGGPNGLAVTGIEHKMGIGGCATCAVALDDAVAWRLADGGRSGGSASNMAAMFVLMNAARMGTAMSGVAYADIAYQNKSAVYGLLFDVAAETLRRLATPHAIDFGTRLLHRGHGGTISFREFLAVAREFVEQRPAQSAVFLAALVALDMGEPEVEAPPPKPTPSRN